MKNPTPQSDISLAYASPACAREASTRALYLPKEAKTRINRYAHQEAKRHEAMVKGRILGLLQALANNGASLQDLLTALPPMLGEPVEPSRLVGGHPIN